MRLSSNQIFWMVATFHYGMSLLLTITPAVTEAKQNAYLSFMLASVVGLFVTWIAIQLHQMYPTLTLVELSQHLLGRIGGRLLLIPFFVQWYTVIGIILRQASELILEVVIPETPISMVVILMLAVVIYASFYGIEVIARCAQVIGPLIYITVGLVILLALKDTQWNRLTPVFVNDWPLDVLKGSLAPASFLGESVLLSMLSPFMINKGGKGALWGMVFASLTLIMSCATVISILSAEMASKIWYPAFVAVRFISVADFVQNLDSIVIIVWLFGIFIKLSTYYFVACYGTSQILNKTNWKRYLFYLAPLFLVLSLLPKDIVQASIVYPKTYWMPYVLPINMIAIPLLLYILAKWRMKQEIVA